MRLIDADAFSAFIKKVVHEHGYDGDGALRICDALTVGDVLNSVCAELDGTALEGFKNAPTVDAVPVEWIEEEIKRLREMDNDFAGLTANIINTMLKRYRKEDADE